MVIRIRTVREEFEAGEDGGYIYGYIHIYGEIQQQRNVPVYVELGTEKEYISSTKDDAKTKYKLFTGCNVFVAENDEQLDREEYISSSHDVTVIIYC